jgi:hypothetical protein
MQKQGNSENPGRTSCVAKNSLVFDRRKWEKSVAFRIFHQSTDQPSPRANGGFAFIGGISGVGLLGVSLLPVI